MARWDEEKNIEKPDYSGLRDEIVKAGENRNISLQVLYALDDTSRETAKTTQQLCAFMQENHADKVQGLTAGQLQQVLRACLLDLAQDGLVCCGGKPGQEHWWVEPADYELTLTPEEEQELADVLDGGPYLTEE